MVSPWVSFVSVSPRIMALFTDKFTTKGVFSDSKCTSKGNKNKSITKSSIESAIFVGKTIGISLFATIISALLQIMTMCCAPRINEW